MTKEQITTLSQIYNTLLLVETKGENTLIIAECIKALQGVINAAAKDAGITMGQVPATEEKGE